MTGLSAQFSGRILAMYEDLGSIPAPHTHIQNKKLKTDQICLVGKSLFWTYQLLLEYLGKQKEPTLVSEKLIFMLFKNTWFIKGRKTENSKGSNWHISKFAIIIYLNENLFNSLRNLSQSQKQNRKYSKQIMETKLSKCHFSLDCTYYSKLQDTENQQKMANTLTAQVFLDCTPWCISLWVYWLSSNVSNGFIN